MIKSKIKSILSEQPFGLQANISGWVKTFRNNQFIALNDGSCLSNLQLVIDRENIDDQTIKKITTGSAIVASGTLVESQGRGQKIELIVDDIKIVGLSDANKYPLQPKKHSLEFLREIGHLRMKTNTFGAIFRIRHLLSFAIHHFFHKRDFVQLHTPIITTSDAEGAGEMFQVTTLPLENIPRNDAGNVDFKKDFFSKSANLTVSGQLEAELGALALSQVYTFGPTFRAENSNTTRHLAEFWMVEPEIAFCDLSNLMEFTQQFLHEIISYVLDHGYDDMVFLQNRLLQVEKSLPANLRSDLPLIDKLKNCIDKPLVQLTYTEAINILKHSKPNKKGKFQFKIEDWGDDLQSEHERFLVEKHFKSPVILYNYPKDIKAFYMRVNEDNQTVAAMDVLYPGIGELIGGSQREERLDILIQRMKDMHIPVNEMDWYLDTRRFGSCPHAGFGLGFERLVLFVTGMSNIRDVIPFPRYPGNAEY